eukprot:scaffold570_cov382-Prasinococcus_capsulatus_cf.AAC.15
MPAAMRKGFPASFQGAPGQLGCLLHWARSAGCWSEEGHQRHCPLYAPPVSCKVCSGINKYPV